MDDVIFPANVVTSAAVVFFANQFLRALLVGTWRKLKWTSFILTLAPVGWATILGFIGLTTAPEIPVGVIFQNCFLGAGLATFVWKAGATANEAVTKGGPGV